MAPLAKPRGCCIPVGKRLQRKIDNDIYLQEFSFALLALRSSIAKYAKPCSQASHTSLVIVPFSGRCPRHSDGCTGVYNQILAVYKEGKRL